MQAIQVHAYGGPEALRLGDVPKANSPHEGLSAWAEPKIVTVRPVQEVVTTGEAGFSIVRDFVLVIACIIENGLGCLIHGDLHRIIRGLAPLVPDVVGEFGALLHRQRIAGEMGRGKFEALGHGVLPGFQGLGGKAIHEIEIDVGESGFPSPMDGGDGVTRKSWPPDLHQFVILHGFRAETNPIDAGVEQSPEV